jgi:hypothetical protein
MMPPCSFTENGTDPGNHDEDCYEHPGAVVHEAEPSGRISSAMTAGVRM